MVGQLTHMFPMDPIPPKKLGINGLTFNSREYSSSVPCRNIILFLNYTDVLNFHFDRPILNQSSRM